jgi:ABC-type nitrate/sulfonate/bicarbonate transport system substrate-binding protein
MTYESFPASTRPEEASRVSSGRIRIGLTALAVLVLALALAACGGDDESDGSAAAGGGSEPEKLTITIGSSTPYYSALWVALANDLFAKHGVELDVLSYNGITTQAQALATGQADLAVTSISSIAALRGQNQESTVLFKLTSWDYRVGALMTKPEIKTLADLEARGNDCKLGTQAPGFGLYGFAIGVTQATNVKCQLVNFGADPEIIAAFTSGAVDAATMSALDALRLKNEGKANLVIDPYTVSEEEGRKYVPNAFPFWVVGGITENIEAKRTAVERFIAALLEAAKMAESMDPQQLGETTKEVREGFDGKPLEDLVTSYELVKPNMATANTARITEEDWGIVLDALTFWKQPGIDPDDPKFSYEEVVDSSYLDKAEADAGY